MLQGTVARLKQPKALNMGEINCLKSWCVVNKSQGKCIRLDSASYIVVSNLTPRNFCLCVICSKEFVGLRICTHFIFLFFFELLGLRKKVELIIDLST